jgi:hypothetical protein
MIIGVLFGGVLSVLLTWWRMDEDVLEVKRDLFC